MVNRSRAARAAIVATLAALLSAGAAKAADGIEWHASLDEALKASQASGKLVMLTLRTDWCTVCQQLAEESWPAEAVVKKSTEFECVKVDPEKVPVPVGYDTGEYPHILFLAADGEIVRDIGGFWPPDELVKEMTHAQEDLPKLREAQEIERKVAKPEDDLAQAFRAGVLYAELGKAKKAIEWLKPVYEHPDALKTEDRPELSLAYGSSLVMDLQYESALPILRELVEKHPDYKRAREARFSLGVALLKTDHPAEARDIWAKLADESREDWFGQAAAHNVKVLDEMLGKR